MLTNGRLMRALNDPNMSITLVKEDNNYKQFQVIGSTGNVYDVLINRTTSTCTCPDFVLNKKRCKHQLLCILNNVTTELSQNTLELGAISVEDLNSYSCSICYEYITGAFYQCKTCHNIYDASCILKWSLSCKALKQKQSCPICRSDLS